MVAAVLAEALEADYWKPVQAGDLDHTDSAKIAALISNDKSYIHPSAYELNTPMSPHAAAAIDGVELKLDAIREPETDNHLIIEGAGGLLVPLNEHQTIADLIRPHYKVILVSRHYLGSINHTLLSLEYLKSLEVEVSIVWSGDEYPSTESIILKKSGVEVLGRIDEEVAFTKEVISRYASAFKDQLLLL